MMKDITSIELELLSLYSAVNNFWAEYVIKTAYDLGLLSKEDYSKHIVEQLKLIKDKE